MAAEASGQALFEVMILLFGLIAVLLLFAVGQEIYRRDRLWRFIAQDENLPDPLEILYCYRVADIQNSETGGENE